jgi:hypothetical protein
MTTCLVPSTAAWLLCATRLGSAGCAAPDDPPTPDGQLESRSSELDLLGDGINSNLEIPLVLVLWEHPSWGGKKRQFIRDEPTLAGGTTHTNFCWNGICQWYGTCRPGPGFDNTASAVGVHPGPDYQAYIARTGHEPTVTLWGDQDYGGAAITLRAGSYANLGNYGMNDCISSVRFDAPAGPLATPDGPAATIGYIPTVVKLHKNSNVSCFGGEADHVITVVESSYSLGAMYGTDWNDSVSAVDVLRGPSWGEWWPSLCSDDWYGGSCTACPVGYSNISSWFNDRASSVLLD